MEAAAVRSAAEVAGLTPTGFVAAAGLTLAGAALPPALSADRQLLAELLQTRTALSRYGTNLNQAVAALHSGAGAPARLSQQRSITAQEGRGVIGKLCRRGTDVRRLLGYLFLEGQAGDRGLPATTATPTSSPAIRTPVCCNRPGARTVASTLAGWPGC